MDKIKRIIIAGSRTAPEEDKEQTVKNSKIVRKEVIYYDE